MCDSRLTISLRIAGSVSLRAIATSCSALFCRKNASMIVLRDRRILLLGVERDQRVAGLRRSHQPEVANRGAAQLDVLLVVGELDQARGVAADEHRLEDALLDVDRRSPSDRAATARRARP